LGRLYGSEMKKIAKNTYLADALEEVGLAEALMALDLFFKKAR
jgi:hypothetical protein